MSIIKNVRRGDDDDDLVDVVVADSFTINVCEHGYTQIGFWIEGEKRPFAIAYAGPNSLIDLARLFNEAIKPMGHA